MIVLKYWWAARNRWLKWIMNFLPVARTFARISSASAALSAIGFLAQDVPAAVERGEGHRPVQEVGHGQRHGVDVRAVEELIEIRERLRRAKLLRRGFWSVSVRSGRRAPGS